MAALLKPERAARAHTVRTDPSPARGPYLPPGNLRTCEKSAKQDQLTALPGPALVWNSTACLPSSAGPEMSPAGVASCHPAGGSRRAGRWFRTPLDSLDPLPFLPCHRHWAWRRLQIGPFETGLKAVDVDRWATELVSP